MWKSSYDQEPPKITDLSIPISTLQHFQSLPWTQNLLRSSLYTPTTCESRIPKPDYEDSFTALTLATNDTIPHLLPLRLKELPIISTSPTPSTPAHLLWLLHLSPQGLSGYPSVLHGGATSTILDESLSSLAGLYYRGVIRPHLISSAPNANNEQTASSSSLSSSDLTFPTGSLTIKFLRPVPLPGTYMVEARIKSIENFDPVSTSKPTAIQGQEQQSKKRIKLHIEGKLRDSEGKSFAEAQGVWVQVGLAKL